MCDESDDSLRPKVISLNPRKFKQVEFKNNSTEPKAEFEITALFTCLYGEGKIAAVSNLADFWVPSSPSYIVLALAEYLGNRIYNIEYAKHFELSDNFFAEFNHKLQYPFW